ncbi:AraC-like DNA-binding protein [Duganella sp. 1411]|uniref:helix-turn-helix domain-containing protein n=1 Tax=Duganella sp. 1411 TaxID=2806572 RepID=UPI001B61BDBD|nr:AraC family transcriptional regulator [Duganella sp. 1411]MBP1206413.1 AraC-like DNA-binding protein [Duganella sp. 1411]
MQEFYKKTVYGLLMLLAASALASYVCVSLSYLSAPLLPAGDSALPWRPEADSNMPQPRIRIGEDRRRLSFDFNLSAHTPYAFAAVGLFFANRDGTPAHVDLSRYTSITLQARCAPANTLTLSASTLESKVSKRGNWLTYRSPSAFFACGPAGTPVELDLTRMETPQWWFDMFKLDLSHQHYKLDQVPKISIGTTFQSPKNIDSRIDIDSLVLTGRDYRYLTLLAVLLGVSWTGFGLWTLRRHTRALIADLKEKLRKDLPLVAYQQLSIEPHRDKEKAVILRFIANGYANAELDLERIVTQTGVNRNKINEILKSEFGYTFSSYLNKLRLTEAARLLAEKETAAVAEIAYSVGYSNVSYFNKLFKEEYGCTPKAFRSVCGQPAGD